MSLKAKNGLIYCSTCRPVKDGHRSLQRRHGLDVTRYHASLGEEECMRNQDEFLDNREPLVMGDGHQCPGGGGR